MPAVTFSLALAQNGFTWAEFWTSFLAAALGAGATVAATWWALRGAARLDRTERQKDRVEERRTDLRALVAEARSNRPIAESTESHIPLATTRLLGAYSHLHHLPRDLSEQVTDLTNDVFILNGNIELHRSLASAGDSGKASNERGAVQRVLNNVGPGVAAKLATVADMLEAWLDRQDESD